MHKIPFDSSRIPKLRAATLGAVTAAIIASLASAENGQIAPSSIEVDGDMFANALEQGLQGAGFVDWVADPDEPNLGSNCVDERSVVQCNEANVSAREGGQGSWNGVRLLDGLGDSDDVYLGGSKFDQPETWVVGPGNVGSTKYDANEIYLANNDDFLYFAMLRYGNNGSTTFDFEFNREAPRPEDQADPSKPYVPYRSVDDILLVFELSGSGKSGSVAVLGFSWDGAQWVEFEIPADTVREINDTAIPAPPWGTRDQKGSWGASDLRRFTFAEVGLKIGPGGIQLPVDPDNCSQSAWVGPRTRASPQFTSDMKDAFPIVEYEFSGLAVAAAKTAESAQNLTMTTSAIVEGNTNPAMQWQVFNGQTQTWENITGQTGSSLVMANDDPQWTYPYASTTIVDSPFSVGGSQFVGHLLETRVRVSATQTTGGSSCTLDSNAVTLKQIVGVDP